MSNAWGRAVSDALEAELRRTVQRQGVVIWFDAQDDDSGLVDRLSQGHAAGKLP